MGIVYLNYMKQLFEYK